MFEKSPRQNRPAVPEPGLRASDADRDRTADVLRDALGDGRITAEEHAERIGAVYRARTLGELEPLVRDLPVDGRARPQAPARPHAAPAHTAGAGLAENLVAVFGAASRKGRWRVSRRTNAFALFGAVEIDLTEAFFEQREIVINATSFFGSVDITVPENVTLRSTGTGIFGGFDVRTVEAPDPDAPVVSVTGFAVFGGVDAEPKRGKRLKNLRAGR
ncbi:DUF1707 domain-containing protein [Streptomyces rectiverticillatus]|uniref:DUF1707 SHOCT-like domain-containing protein n=1 Tax=Streptomyces rectiverticillatus TaxID=173860 RepID=UPI0015C2E214|nr:DUF1707 domain-containing protein [Streptomyces rectiverticillatus]QLE76237.1 DUF1707 domain-containing protein [Streptomyces rectiverticillatus]